MDGSGRDRSITEWSDRAQRRTTPRRCRAVAVAAVIVSVVMAATVSGDIGTGGGGGGAAAAVKRSDSQCPDGGCAAVRCPRDQDACPLGLAPDGCGCCPYGVCGLGEAAECNAADRPCANHLECVKTETINGGGDPADPVVYRCACKDREPVCGSDNRTYANACQLNEAAAPLQEGDGNETSTTLATQHLGPCHSAPVIRSVPKNAAGSSGQPVVFDCEVSGYPVPSISWQFTDANGISKWLPGDDTLIAIQIRGGPDRLAVTSWVQIVEFRASHVGNYTCLAANAVDTTAASAVLDARKMT